jgi:hypothetical protein
MEEGQENRNCLNGRKYGKKEDHREEEPDDFEEDLKTMVIRNWHAVVRNGKEWRRILLEVQLHNGM